jgi:hypothetical protein
MEKVIAFIIIMGTIIWTMMAWSKTPVVYVSYSTGECVKVILDGEQCDCSNIPDSYERVWVK